MHDAPKRFNELEGDFKKSSIGEYANRGEAADQINQTASNAGERPIACIIQVILLREQEPSQSRAYSSLQHPQKEPLAPAKTPVTPPGRQVPRPVANNPEE